MIGKVVKQMLRTLWQLWRDEDGVTTVEYALLLALIVVASIGAWSALGRNVNDILEMVDSEIQGPTN